MYPLFYYDMYTHRICSFVLESFLENYLLKTLPPEPAVKQITLVIKTFQNFEAELFLRRPRIYP